MLSQWQNPLTAEQRLAMRTYAERAYPKETCGFILIDGSVVECRNISDQPDTFVMNAQDTADYIDDAKACWHSHADYSGFSPADIKASKTLNMPYAVWNCGGSEAFWLDPSQDAGLLGRAWNYGVYDCYSAVRDWYKQQLGIQLGDYPRRYEGEWSKPGFVFFEKNFAAEGFAKLPSGAELVRGDVILFRIRNQDVCNHVAVVEDPAANKLYQHLIGRLAGTTSYSAYFRENAYMVVRRAS